MAAASHFSARVYGEIEGQPPFQNASGQTAFTRSKNYPAPPVVSFPTAGTNIWALPNGTVVGGAYVYSVIEILPTGLTAPQQGKKYVSDSSAATLATNAG